MIRPAVCDDLVAILAIYNEIVKTSPFLYDETEHSLREMAYWFDRKAAKAEPVLVWEEGGIVGGYGSYGPFRPWPGYEGAVEESVYTAAADRRRGIGSSLLAALVQAAGNSGYSVIVAAIDQANEPSIRLHEQSGFSYSGLLPKVGKKWGLCRDLCFYYKELPDVVKTES